MSKKNNLRAKEIYFVCDGLASNRQNILDRKRLKTQLNQTALRIPSLLIKNQIYFI